MNKLVLLLVSSLLVIQTYATPINSVRNALALVEEKKSQTQLAVENKEKEPITLASVVVGILVDLAKNAITKKVESALADDGQCVVSELPPLNSFEANGIPRENDILQYCKKTPISWDTASRADTEKKYSVFAARWTIFQKCKFEFHWGPGGGNVWDCTEKTVAENIAHNQNAKEGLMQELLSKYPNNEHANIKIWGYHVTDFNLKVPSTQCVAQYHKAYVRDFIAFPESFWNDKETYAADPYLFIDIEGWTGGSCSGIKAPGVSWIFSYKLDLKSGIVTFDNKRDENNRPVFSEPQYVLKLTNGQQGGQGEVIGYREQTTSICTSYLHVSQCPEEN